MSTSVWTESLLAPRSLATRETTAVAAIEDPGVIDLHLAVNDLYVQRRCEKILGGKLPMKPWASLVAEDRRIVWTRPWRWQVIAPREGVDALLEELRQSIAASIAADLTGAFAALRVAGANSNEVLARVCALDLAPVEPGFARGTSIAGVRCLLIREESSVPSWQVLAPRSYGVHVSASLVEAIRTPGRLALFGTASPPPV